VESLGVSKRRPEDLPGWTGRGLQVFLTGNIRHGIQEGDPAIVTVPPERFHAACAGVLLAVRRVAVGIQPFPSRLKVVVTVTVLTRERVDLDAVHVDRGRAIGVPVGTLKPATARDLNRLGKGRSKSVHK
jgi:hypothetical protein